MNNSNPTRQDPRRTLVLLIAITLLLIWGVSTVWMDRSGAANFASAAAGRIGLVMGALWMAWPSLRRPASWLPPGLPIVLIAALAVLAAQPRLVFVAVPVIGGLLALGTLVRAFKR